jgi:hypothetical protein
MGERFFNVQRWTTMPRGGHFAALEDRSAIGSRLPSMVSEQEGQQHEAATGSNVKRLMEQ